jgi:hypothetical protein
MKRKLVSLDRLAGIEDQAQPVQPVLDVTQRDVGVIVIEEPEAVEERGVQTEREQQDQQPAQAGSRMPEGEHRIHQIPVIGIPLELIFWRRILGQAPGGRAGRRACFGS